MAGKYLVEYIQNEGNISIVHRTLGRVRFPDNPDYDGRRVVEVETSSLRDELLEAGNPPHGPARYCEPPDLLANVEKQKIREVVRDCLVELGFTDLPATASIEKMDLGAPLSQEEVDQIVPKVGDETAETGDPEDGV